MEIIVHNRYGRNSKGLIESHEMHTYPQRMVLEKLDDSWMTQEIKRKLQQQQMLYNNARRLVRDED